MRKNSCSRVVDVEVVEGCLYPLHISLCAYVYVHIADIEKNEENKISVQSYVYKVIKRK